VVNKNGLVPTAFRKRYLTPFPKRLSIQSEAGDRIKASWKRIAVIGVCIIGTYQLVLFALTMAPVAIISPLRESASVVVTLWGIWKLKETQGMYPKLSGALMIFIGIILLAF